MMNEHKDALRVSKRLLAEARANVVDTYERQRELIKAAYDAGLIPSEISALVGSPVYGVLFGADNATQARADAKPALMPAKRVRPQRRSEPSYSRNT
jgi:hypothetical protein